jgi:hypothetical protein
MNKATPFSGRSMMRVRQFVWLLGACVLVSGAAHALSITFAYTGHLTQISSLDPESPFPDLIADDPRYSFGVGICDAASCDHHLAWAASTTTLQSHLRALPLSRSFGTSPRDRVLYFQICLRATT